MSAVEVNFDGLVGPTHNYGGLAYGNLASMNNLGDASNPRAAVLQGLGKMRALMQLGLTQGVLPPHERPSVKTLRAFGFTGSDAQVIESAWCVSPKLVINCASASSMWTANAATVSPSADTADSKVHFTPANLGSMFHRAIEPNFTGHLLRRIFRDKTHFCHHHPIPYGGRMGDEGAANHGRLATEHGAQGIELFVYGHSAFGEKRDDLTFQARQAIEASQGIAANHQLNQAHTVYLQQSAKAIDAGAFHNDVVAVSNGTALFYHEDAFENKNAALDALASGCQKLGFEPVCIEVPADQVSLDTAITTYLFNSQLITLPGGEMALILPTETLENEHTSRYVSDCISSNSPIAAAHYFDLKQSMKNGGGPACLRLRVVVTEDEIASLGNTCLMTKQRLSALEAWATRHYRDRLMPEDLRDPELLVEANTALDTLTGILGLGSIYDFQL